MNRIILTFLFVCIYSFNVNAITNLEYLPSDSISFYQSITRSGSKCKRNAKTGTKYCWQHDTTIINSKSRCQAIIRSGSQCKRNAKTGTKYCWQHQK